MFVTLGKLMKLATPYNNNDQDYETQHRPTLNTAAASGNVTTPPAAAAIFGQQQS